MRMFKFTHDAFHCTIPLGILDEETIGDSLHQWFLRFAMSPCDRLDTTNANASNTRRQSVYSRSPIGSLLRAQGEVQNFFFFRAIAGCFAHRPSNNTKTNANMPLLKLKCLFLAAFAIRCFANNCYAEA